MFLPEPVVGTEGQSAFAIMDSRIPVDIATGVIANLPVVTTLNAHLKPVTLNPELFPSAVRVYTVS